MLNPIDIIKEIKNVGLFSSIHASEYSIIGDITSDDWYIILSTHTGNIVIRTTPYFTIRIAIPILGIETNAQPALINILLNINIKGTTRLVRAFRNILVLYYCVDVPIDQFQEHNLRTITPIIKKEIQHIISMAGLNNDIPNRYTPKNEDNMDDLNDQLRSMFNNAQGYPDIEDIDDDDEDDDDNQPINN